VSKIIHPTETTASAVDASWFCGAALSSITRLQQHVWVFAFSSNASITVECLWRVLTTSIVVTSEDHQQKFGLPAPLDAVSRASEILVGDTINEFVLRADSLDLLFTFSRAQRLEILPTSAGYEAWQIVSPRRQHFIAVGGGRLDTYTDET
jgi:hypothetical protein